MTSSEIYFSMNHAPCARPRGQTIDLQSTSLPLCCDCSHNHIKKNPETSPSHNAYVSSFLFGRCVPRPTFNKLNSSDPQTSGTQHLNIPFRIPSTSGAFTQTRAICKPHNRRLTHIHVLTDRTKATLEKKRHTA